MATQDSSEARGIHARLDFLRELGVRPIINGAGTYTMMTASLLAPEVVEAMAAVSGHFVRLEDLQDAVGRRIAALLRCEAAMVTSGAFAALTLGTAACITGTNPEFIRRLPDTDGMQNEVIIQTSHRFPYDRAVRNCGVRLIEVETPLDLERALNARTAMMLFLNKNEPQGRITAAEWVRLGKAHGIPTLNDAAADVPPLDNLFTYTRMGFDLVAFSGGKGLQGPQTAGLLLGRSDLIHAARLNTAPHSDTIGRGLKVGREEMVGMLVALERYLRRDHDAEWREWERRITTIATVAASIRGVTTDTFVPQIANQVPHLRIRWDRHLVTVSPADATRRLREGDPSIELVPVPYQEGCLEVAAWTLQPGEAETVARRIHEVLTGTPSALP
ncbi:MAG TPA: selenocysteine synthase [bacterium]|nr:selenocysteine synthase [bacterium]